MTGGGGLQPPRQTRARRARGAASLDARCEVHVSWRAKPPEFSCLRPLMAKYQDF